MRGMLNGSYMTRIIPVPSPRVRYIASSEVLYTQSSLIHLSCLSVHIFTLVCYVEVITYTNIMEKRRLKWQVTKNTEVILVCATST
jgi:hypothetical protein